MTIYNEIRGFNTSNNQASAHGDSDGRRDINLLISILIESGLITFVGQLAQSIMFKFVNDTFPLISGSVVMFYVRASNSCRLLIWCFNLLLITQGISMIDVLVRVEIGDSLDHNTLLRTVNSPNSGPSTPLNFRANQTTNYTTTEVGRFNSSSNDAYPETQFFTGTSSWCSTRIGKLRIYLPWPLRQKLYFLAITGTLGYEFS